MNNLNCAPAVHDNDGERGLEPNDRDGVFPGDSAHWRAFWRDGTEWSRRRSAEVRADISYGKHESERFDLYLPTPQPRNRPFAVYVHGGAWRGARLGESGYPAKAVHRHGAAFVAVGFDAVPAVSLEQQVDQVRRAWRYLIANAERFGLDPTRGHLIGHASGAHLAALAAFDPAGVPPRSVVLVSGVYDLEPVRALRGNEELALSSVSSARLSPIHCISHSAVDVVVAWGALESRALRQQSLAFVRACKTRGLRTFQGELDGRAHFDTSLELANPHSPVLTTLRGRA